MDPLSASAALVGLALAVAGTAAMLAWRHRRARGRLPALLLGLAVTVLALPAALESIGEVVDPGGDTMSVDDAR